MNRIVLYIAAMLLIAPMLTSAQEEERKTFGIGIVPQYAISNGARFDFDFRLKKKGQWLIVAPQVYINPGNSTMWDYEEMYGAGIDLQHRFFFKDRVLPKGTYLAYGTVFQYFNVKDDALQAYAFEENGVEYYDLRDEMSRTNIYKFGGNLIFGVQVVISKFFYLDGYIGTGIRLSFDDRASGLHGFYRDWWGDMGYSGTLITAGVRFGVTL